MDSRGTALTSRLTHLARLEAHTAVEHLLRRLPGLRLAEPAAPRGLVFRKPPALRVVWG